MLTDMPLCVIFALNMSEVCMIYVWIMPYIFLRFACNLMMICWDKSGIYLRYTWDISEIYLRDTWNMPESCLIFDCNMPDVCQRYTGDMPEICQANAYDVPELCLRFFWDLPQIWLIPDMYLRICLKFSRDFSEIFLKYAWDTPLVFLRYAGICLRNAWLLPGIHIRCARDMLELCLRYTGYLN